LPPPKKPKSPKRKSKLHPIVRWLRTAGITAELFGWAGLLLVGWFWPAAIFIYAGFLLLVSCPGDFVSGAPPPTARLTLDLADWLGLSRVDYCFHYHRDSSLAIDVWLEPELRNYLGWRIGVIAILVVLAATFSRAIVFANVPLEVTAFVTDADYSSDTKKIADIAWKTGIYRTAGMDKQSLREQL
jgi:hypothetical protein